MSDWMKVLFGGLGVAVFTFLADAVWDRVSHRSAGPDTVHTALRVEDGALYVFVRNDSDEPLDLVRAQLTIRSPKPDVMGAYPLPSRIYRVVSEREAQLDQQDDLLLVQLNIAQAINPGEADQFGFSIEDRARPLTPGQGTVQGEITDLKGNVYAVSY